MPITRPNPKDRKGELEETTALVLKSGIGDANLIIDDFRRPRGGNTKHHTMLDYNEAIQASRDAFIAQYIPSAIQEDRAPIHGLSFNGVWAKAVFTKKENDHLHLSGLYYITFYSIAAYALELTVSNAEEAAIRGGDPLNIMRSEILSAELDEQLNNKSINKFNDIWVIKNTQNPKEPKLSIVLPNKEMAKNIRLKHLHEDLISFATSNTTELDEYCEQVQLEMNNLINLTTN